MREGIIKHSHFHDRPAAQEFDPSTYPCLEAQIVDLADEIAYLGHDVDDGLKAGMLTVEELEQSQLYRDASALHAAAMKSASSAIRRCAESSIRWRPIWSPTSTRKFTRARIDSVDAVRSAGRALALFSAPMTLQVDELKTIMREKLYRHYRVIRMTEKAGRVLEHLFNAYMSEPRQMPSHVLMLHERDGETIARVVADYIAGMTDRFALDEYKKLFDPDERV